MKVLVTGAKGMLGQDLCPILEQNGYEVIKTDADTMDITKIDVVREVIEEVSPEIVIHCAAYTNVDKAEEDFEIARNINVLGTENLSKICAKENTTLVYISTDYVFDGEKKEPYLTSDIPNPLNNYGVTKFQGEEAVKKYCKKYFIARTSWLYGIHGRNFVETMLELATSEETSSLKVVDDQIGCPTHTVDLANGILKLLKTEKYGVYHLCSSGKTSWYGFAKEIFKQAGLTPELIPCTTEEFARPAKRPRYSVMENDGLCPFWVDGLTNYFKIRG